MASDTKPDQQLDETIRLALGTIATDLTAPSRDRIDAAKVYLTYWGPDTKSGTKPGLANGAKPDPGTLDLEALNAAIEAA